MLPAASSATRDLMMRVARNRCCSCAAVAMQDWIYHPGIRDDTQTKRAREIRGVEQARHRGRVQSQSRWRDPARSSRGPYVAATMRVHTAAAHPRSCSMQWQIEKIWHDTTLVFVYRALQMSTKWHSNGKRFRFQASNMPWRYCILRLTTSDYHYVKRLWVNLCIRAGINFECTMQLNAASSFSGSHTS